MCPPMLPKQARYQLRYTRIWCVFRLFGGQLFNYNPKCGGLQECIAMKVT